MGPEEFDTTDSLDPIEKKRAEKYIDDRCCKCYKENISNILCRDCMRDAAIKQLKDDVNALLEQFSHLRVEHATTNSSGKIFFNIYEPADVDTGAVKTKLVHYERKGDNKRRKVSGMNARQFLMKLLEEWTEEYA